MTRALLQRLRADESGVAVLELALAAPVLAVLIMGTADVGAAFSRKLSLEQGAQRAVEKVMQTTELDNVQDTIAGEVAVQASVREDQVQVTFPRYCDNRKMPDVERDGLFHRCPSLPFFDRIPLLKEEGWLRHQSLE